VETNGSALVGFLKTVPGEKHLILEEGTMAQWMFEILRPHVKQVVVVGVLKARGSKTDKRDAFGLAEQLRVGSMATIIHKGRGKFSRLSTLSKTYGFITGDVVRVKNRLKSVFRSRGISTPGKEVYSRKTWEEYLVQLPYSHIIQAEIFLAQLEGLQEILKRTKKEMLKEARSFPEFHILKTVPGLGDIRVSQLIPIVATPYRFQNKRLFWAYCGYGVVMNTSADWEHAPNGSWVKVAKKRTRGLNYNHNHKLKCIFKSAVITVISQKIESEPVYQHYCSLLENGTKPDLAKLTIARQIASITLSVWRSMEEYDPKRMVKSKK